MKNKGFTIVETLVAITVLMIAVAGPLVVASRGLTAALLSKDQMIATFLAQESMEVIKNVRDNGPIGQPGWLDDFNGQGCVVTTAGAKAYCDASAVVGITPSASCPTTGCRLYIADPEGYVPDPSGRPTIFYRYFYIERPTAWDTDHARANVVVAWNEGTIPYEINLTSELVNVIR